MTRSHRWLLAISVMLIILGLVLAALPKDWMESTLGIEPDQGNGAAELLVFLVPLVAGVVLGAVVLVRNSRVARAQRS